MKSGDKPAAVHFVFPIIPKSLLHVIEIIKQSSKAQRNSCNLRASPHSVRKLRSLHSGAERPPVSDETNGLLSRTVNYNPMNTLRGTSGLWIQLVLGRWRVSNKIGDALPHDAQCDGFTLREGLNDGTERINVFHFASVDHQHHIPS